MQRTPKNRPSAPPPARGVCRHPDAPLRAGLYARVSTADQQSLPDQIDQLRAYALARGWVVVLEEPEVGSGARDRPGRRRLTEAARRREIDVILVAKLDRWGRALGDIITSVDELTELGVGFVALGDSFDLTTAPGRAMLGMLAVFAAFERDRINERVREGIAAAQARGVRFGRRPTKDRHREEVREMFAAGMSKRAIGASLKISRDTVRRYLTEPTPDA